MRDMLLCNNEESNGRGYFIALVDFFVSEVINLVCCYIKLKGFLPESGETVIFLYNNIAT